MDIEPDIKDWTWVLDQACPEFTVATLAQYFLHDVVHHLHDVRG